MVAAHDLDFEQLVDGQWWDGNLAGRATGEVCQHLRSGIGHCFEVEGGRESEVESEEMQM